MVKEQKIIGLSPDLIIHPGETLTEILEDRDMSQKELAIRTGMTEKHISTIVKGQKNISSCPGFVGKNASSVLRNRLILLLTEIVKGGLAYGVRYPYLIKI